MAFLGLTRNLRHERSGFALYSAAVAAARDPFFYTALAVPDTLDGRFDLVGLHAFLVIHRLRGDAERQASRVAQAVFDAMFADMDVNLREIGVGDMSVGKRVKAMWEAFHGRSAAYAAALADGDGAAMEGALRRNVWRGEAAGGVTRLARVVAAQERALGAQPTGDLVAGVVRFLAAEQAAA